MEEQHSKLWRVALVLSLAAFAAAAYFKIPPFRAYVDEKFPVVKQQLAQRGIVLVDDPSEAYADPAAPTPAIATPTPKPALTLEQIAADRSLWPKDIRLKTQVVFPSVLEGREVGKITVSAGTSVQIYKIEHQKVAVIYKGGGAWVPVADTDLLERARQASQ